MTPTPFIAATLAPFLLAAGRARSAPAAAEPSLLRIVVPLAMIVVLAGILLGALSLVRRRMRQSDQPILRGFTLSDLRELHASGKLTDEEFERAKAKIVANVQSTLKKEAKPSPLEQPLNVEPKE